MTPTEPGFRAFSAPHVIVIVLSIALPLLLAAAFRRTRSRALDRFVSISLAGLLVFNYLGYAVYLWLVECWSGRRRCLSNFAIGR